MKSAILTFLIILLFYADVFSENPVFKWIFIPHPRSDNETGVLINPGVEKIDFSKYDVKLLGGDLTVYVNEDSAMMNYADSFFDLGNPNTLWAVGNHDVSGTGGREIISAYTGRDTYYSYARDGVQFLVLDCELDAAPEFANSFISGAQLDTVRAVCDRITSDDTKFLVILHHRFLWMINNDHFTDILANSVATSSMSMDTTNFYSDIYPLLQSVKAKGIEVYVFGGDRINCNIDRYSIEDGIYFYASIMKGEFSDSVNSIIDITYTENRSIECRFLTLAELAAMQSIDVKRRPVKNAAVSGKKGLFCIRPAPGRGNYAVSLQNGARNSYKMEILTSDGRLAGKIDIRNDAENIIHVKSPGIYIARLKCGSTVFSGQFAAY